jgi:hypothetical protein
MQSQQIRGALPRTVTPVSSRYPQLLCVFGVFSPLRDASRRKIPARDADRTARAASSELTMHQRARRICINPKQARGV